MTASGADGTIGEHRAPIDAATITVGVIGAGVMGSGIAQVTATAGFPTRCCDQDPDALARAAERLRTGRYGLDRGVELGKLTRTEADAALARLELTASFDAAAASDLVIEAVPEDLELKRSIFRDLDAAAPATSVLASNTSGFSIAAIASATDRADRVIGWHWASPPPVMRLAEIVRTDATSDAAVALVQAVAASCGKRPIVIRDVDGPWGFVANRVYFAMIREAERVVEEGVATRDQVDALMIDCFRWPIGPFTLVGGARAGWSDDS